MFVIKDYYSENKYFYNSSAMTFFKKFKAFSLLCLVCILFSFSSCLTSASLDKFVAKKYDNELPKLSKRKHPDIVVNSLLKTDGLQISTSVHKTEKFLPLIVYWQYYHRQKCSLNSSIAVVNFSNAVTSLSNKGLINKLNGRKLELTVEQAPSGFSLVMDENVVWIVYAFSWVNVILEPDMNDLVVSYKVMGGEENKAGKITIKNTDQVKGLRYFQSWKSATSEYLYDYNTNFTAMTNAFVKQLINEL